MSDVAAFLGRFHPLLVHFPIALLAAAASLSAWSSWRERRGGPTPARGAVLPLLVLGASSAVVAAIAGYLLGGSGGYGGLVYERHEQLGILLAVSAVLTVAAAAVVTRRPTRVARVAYAVLLVHTLFVLAGAGHLGATLTHGDGYLTARAPASLRPTLVRLGLTDAVAQRGEAAQAVAYTALVAPILRARCAACHGAQEAMGRLRLDTPEGLQKGGEHGPVLSPGRPASSELLRRVSLPATDEHAMPPRGRRPVTAGEGALLRWWIAAGAPFERTVGELEVGPEVRPIVEATLGPLSIGGPTLPRASLPAPDPAAIARVQRAGLSVKPVAAGLHFLDIRVTSTGRGFGDGDVAVLQPIGPQLVWLDLAGTRVGDGGLAAIGRLPNLVRLDLARTAITDAGVAQLTRLEHLESLNLYGTRVTDAAVQQLAALKALRRLYLWQTGVTAEGVERLRSALPRLEVDSGTEARSVSGTQPGAAAVGSR